MRTYVEEDHIDLKLKPCVYSTLLSLVVSCTESCTIGLGSLLPFLICNKTNTFTCIYLCGTNIPLLLCNVSYVTPLNQNMGGTLPVTQSRTPKQSCARLRTT